MRHQYQLLITNCCSSYKVKDMHHALHTREERRKPRYSRNANLRWGNSKINLKETGSQCAYWCQMAQSEIHGQADIKAATCLTSTKYASLRECEDLPN
jgi:hypothetical protein